MTDFYSSSEYQHVVAIKHHLKTLHSQLNAQEDPELASHLQLLHEFREVKRSFDFLNRSLEQESILLMQQMNLESIETPHWNVSLETTPKRATINQDEAAEACLNKIQERAIQSFSNIPEQAVKDITANAFWTTLKHSSVKWSTAKLKNLHLPQDVLDSKEPTTTTLKMQKVDS